MIIRRPPVKKPSENEDWLMSYADMLTLLLAFFVLLLSMSKFDLVKYEKVESGMAKEIGKRDGPQPIKELRTDITDLLQGLKVDDSQIHLGSDDRGLVLELDGASFFDANSATLKPTQVEALSRMAQMLDHPRYSFFQVEVQGHTDDSPISGGTFPTNWELSSARASAVVRLFINHGMTPTRLSAMGFAETRPKVANRDANGNPLPINQGINRRVVIHIYPR